MPLVVPQGDTWMDSRLTQLDSDLREGKPEIGWRGDPRLRLQIGVLERRVRGRVTGVWRKIELWRSNEDGSDRCIAHWDEHEVDRILPDLIAMDPRTPGHVPTLERIDAANEAKEREEAAKFRDTYGEMAEHAIHVAGGKKRFYVDGLKDKRKSRKKTVTASRRKNRTK